MENTFFENAEKELDGIKFYQSHPTLKPFIGKNYLSNELGMKILLVGESHYVEEPLPEITSDSLLSDWWGEAPPLINDISWYTTRGTIGKFILGDSGKSYALFRAPCEIYNQCVLNGKYQTWQEIYSIFDSFAFINYFQMPALYEGMAFRTSLWKLNGENKKYHPKSSEIFDKTKKLSNDVFLSVIEILKPDKIIFLSMEAYRAFTGLNEDYDKNRVFGTDHPTCHWWNRKKKDGLSGKERLVKFFNTLVSERK